MFCAWTDASHPAMQGDIGEWSAVGWLDGPGRKVFLPLGHSPDVDLGGGLRRRARARAGEDAPRSAATAGSRSPSRPEAATAAGAAWRSSSPRRNATTSSSTSATAGDGSSRLTLSRADRACASAGRSTRRTRSNRTVRCPSWPSAGSLDCPAPGGVPERSKGMDCKSIGSAFAGSNPAPAIAGPLGPVMVRVGAQRTRISGRCCGFSASAGRRGPGVGDGVDRRGVGVSTTLSHASESRGPRDLLRRGATPRVGGSERAWGLLRAGRLRSPQWGLSCVSELFVQRRPFFLATRAVQSRRRGVLRARRGALQLRPARHQRLLPCRCS